MNGQASRFAVFLRPDPLTCWAAIQLTSSLEKQFGLRAAGAIAPHVTLLANLATDSTAEELTRILDPVMDSVEPFTVYNSGIVRTSGNTFAFDVNRDVDGRGANVSLCAVATAVKDALLPVSRPVSDHLVTPVAAYEFAGRIGLASQELFEDPTMADEVDEYLHGLPVLFPDSFTARWFSLFEMQADWTGRWWQDQSWNIVKSWSVAGDSSREFLSPSLPDEQSEP